MPNEPDPVAPAATRPPTDWSESLVTLVTDTLGSTDAGPELDTVLAVVAWLRDHHLEARILIGDLTKGY